MKFKLLIITLLFSSAVIAQRDIPPTISVHLDAGYGLSLPAEQFVVYSEDGARTSAESIDLKSAGGLQLALALGIELRNDFRFMVHGHYQRGSLVNIYEEEILQGGDITSIRNRNPQSLRFSSFSVSTLVQYRYTKLNRTWYPVFSIGPSLYVWGQEDYTYNLYTLGGGLNYEAEGNMKTGLSLGGRATIGVERKLSEKLFLSMGLQLRASFIAPKLLTITKIEQEGEDITANYSNRELQLEYLKEYDSNFGPNPSQPQPTAYRARPYVAADLIFSLSYFLN